MTRDALQSGDQARAVISQGNLLGNRVTECGKMLSIIAELLSTVSPLMSSSPVNNSAMSAGFIGSQFIVLSGAAFAPPPS